MLNRIRSNYASVAATLALIAAVGGTAIGATGTQSAKSGLLRACVAKKGKQKGVMRLVSGSKCKKSEKLVTWNRTGPAGSAGSQGERGQAGPTGPAGAPGQTGPTGARGPTGASGVDGQSIPAHLVAVFNATSCPAGWTEYTLARGRYFVGLPNGGTLGGTDGTALTDLEDRPTGKHTHAVTDPGHTHSIDTNSILSGGNVTPVGVMGTADTQPSSIHNVIPGAAQLSTTGITIDPAGTVDGTNAPYIQLLACEKA